MRWSSTLYELARKKGHQIFVHAAVFSALLLIFGVPSRALDPAKSLTQYAHRTWGQEEGLFQPTIYSILQTHDGFLWLGTQDSLIRFDGVHFREFAEGTSTLHGSLIRALAEDSAGNLWAGSLGDGLVRIQPDGAIRQFSTRSGMPSDSIFCLAADNGNAIWACTPEGLVRISHNEIRVFNQIDGLLSKRIRSACLASDGTLWAAGLDGGLSHLAGSRFTAYSSEQLPSGRAVTALACGAAEGVWAGTSFGLVHISDTGSRLYTTRDGLPDNEVSALTESADGAVWIGTNDGISRLLTGEISAYRLRDGLSHSQVLSLRIDREGTLWAGTKNGLDQFTNGKVTPYTTNEGLLSNNVGPVLEDSGGRLWIGTLDSGLNSFDGRRFRSLTKAKGLLSNTVLSLALDPTGDLWVGTNNGINRVSEDHVIASYTLNSGLPGSEVRSLFIDVNGSLWAGTESGLAHLVRGRFLAAPVANRKEPASVVAVSGGNSVPLFASLEDTSLYLLRANGLVLHSLDITHPVDSFLRDTVRHAIWMGTLGSGLLRWKNNKIAHIYVKDGLYDNRLYGILPDQQNNLWFSSSKGIFRLSEQELNDFADGKLQRVQSLPFSTGQLRFECRSGVQPAACRTKDGHLWFSTTNGLVVLDPNHLRDNTVPPPIAVTALIANGQRMAGTGQPHLKPSTADNIEIRYAGLSYISPEKVTFRYRLDGYDRSWIDANERRSAFYTNLPPGTFQFHVEARNADGVWSRSAATFPFVIEPRIYQRLWFFPALALFAALLVLAGFRFRIRRLRQRFEVVLAERNRIARELHDTLLQGLSGITMQMQALWTKLPASKEKNFLGEIIKDAGQCSAEARQSLWNLRTPGPQGGQFSGKLASLAREVVHGKHISLTLAIEPLSLAELPDTEYQLLRIAREAMSNTLKHAGALHLTVSLQTMSGVLRLEIADDGFGFAQDERAISGHFGLQGMRERAEEIGAELSVRSAPESGTCITIVLALKPNARIAGNRPAIGVHQV